MFLTLAISSCNSSNDEPTSGEIISSSSNTSTLVSSFTLGSNKKVLYNLDSVYFSIDQEKISSTTPTLCQKAQMCRTSPFRSISPQR